MDLAAVMAEIGTRLDTIVGLRVFPYTADSVSPPVAAVGLPESIDFDQTYGRGSDTITLPVTVLVGKVSDRASHLELSAYCNGSGAKSVKATLDSSTSNTYSECDTVRVSTVEFATYTGAGVQLLGAEFTIEITGTGS